jgi:very-short-patch-repair endonuclease
VERTAAWIHRLDVNPANPVQVSLPPGCRLISREGLEIRHSDLTGETLEINGIRVTCIHRTLLDLCARSSPVEALVVLDMAVLARLTYQDALLGYAGAVRGRAGASRLRSLARIAAPAESPMETRLRWLLVKARLPMPDVQSDLYDEADLYYPQAHLVIEFDGGNHRDRLVSDDRRQNSLTNAGYRILRFTSADVYGRPHGIVAEVRAAVRGYRSGR